MPEMWVPPKVRQELAESTLKQNAELREQAMTDKWTRELKNIDPHLELVRAPMRTSVAGLRPGYWHLLRWNPGGPASIMPVEHEDGSFRVPDSSLLRDLAKSDMWNSTTRRAAEKARESAQAAAERQKRRESKDRADEINERLRSRDRTQVLFR